jgi:putative ABC transport system permease protein
MRKLRALWMRLAGVLNARRAKDDFDDELASHIELHMHEGERSGLGEAEARRQALIRLGGAEQARQAYRDRATLPCIENLLRDVRYALRGFRRNQAFTVTVILTLALGIGATTAVFSVVDRILFRALPYAHADRLVSIGMVHSLERQEFMMGGFYFDWRANQKPFDAMAIQGTMPHACDLVENNPAQLECLSFNAEFLPLLGIAPMLGRNFLPEEDRPNGPHVVLISYSLWRSHYNHDPGILNRLINVDGSPARVVGVLPRDFQFPTLQSADVIFPMALNRAAQGTANGGFGDPMRTFARLRPGVSITQARAQMEPLFLHTRDTFIPRDVRKDVHLSIRSLRDRETQDVQLTAWILFGSVLAVLLIACANVAVLMMARAEARERELAVRSMLGASQGQLIRQTLTEAILLSLAGAAIGMALAECLLRIFKDLAPTSIPFLSRDGLDLRIALFTVLLSLLCGVLSGLLPSLQTPRAVALAARAAKFRKRSVLRRTLVAGQIAISMILLSGAALLLKSFQNMQNQSLGIETGGVSTVKIALPRFRYNTDQKEMDFYLQAEAAIRRLPGVRAVAISDSVPPGGGSGFRWSDFAVEGRPNPEQGTGGSADGRTVTPDYFHALDIPIVRGRNFTEADRQSTESPIIISRLMAARLFPGEDPIGKRVHSTREDKWSTVVGVAENAKNGGLLEPDLPEMYILRRNNPSDWEGRTPVIIVDSLLSPKVIAPWVQSQIAQIDSTVPVTVETLNQQVSRLADRPRFETALLGFFAFTGLVMAIIGLYGVIAFMAVQRTQEIGVRMALGASRLNILQIILREGLRLVALGGTVGLVAALLLSRVLKSLLFGIGPHDPASFVAVAVLLALAALAATLVPARSAMKTDPMAALRWE